MKTLYWRPRKVSRMSVLAIALLSLVGMAVVEWVPVQHVAPHQQQMHSASQLALRGMQVIKDQRIRQGHAVQTHFDPSNSGLIGHSMSLVTSVPGNLRSKQTSVNPNFAAAVVDMLLEAGVQQGDCVAVGCSGSFPALNLCVYSALETLQAKPVIVLSATASQFGANIPDLMWVDMERVLLEHNLVSFRAVGASLGGFEDCGAGMCDEARQLVAEALRRNDTPLLKADNLASAIDERMEIYQQHAGDQPIKAYINVGGGAASTGRSEGKQRYRPGLNLAPPPTATEIDSVMTRFAKAGTPVIHLVEINQLAAQLGLPEAPQQLPEVGQGRVYAHHCYNRYLAAALLAVIGVSLRVFVLSNGTARLQRLLRARSARQQELANDAYGVGELMV